MMIPDHLEQEIIENSDYVRTLEHVLTEAKALVEGQPCVAHDRRPCETCIVGIDWDDLRDAVEAAELAR